MPTQFGDPYDNKKDNMSRQSTNEREGEKKRGNKKSKKKSNNKSNNNNSNNSSSGGRYGFSGGLTGITQLFVLIATIMQILVAIIHIVDALEDLEQCEEDKNTDIECVGESLFWDHGGKDAETDSDLNIHWRLGGFTFVPSIFIDLWTPVVFAALGILQMFNATKWSVISGNMLRGCIFLLIMALFGTYGYSGQLGVASGFIVCFGSFMCLVSFAVRSGGAPFPVFR